MIYSERANRLLHDRYVSFEGKHNDRVLFDFFGGVDCMSML